MSLPGGCVCASPFALCSLLCLYLPVVCHLAFGLLSLEVYSKLNFAVVVGIHNIKPDKLYKPLLVLIAFVLSCFSDSVHCCTFGLCCSSLRCCLGVKVTVLDTASNLLTLNACITFLFLFPLACPQKWSPKTGRGINFSAHKLCVHIIQSLNLAEKVQYNLVGVLA